MPFKLEDHWKEWAQLLSLPGKIGSINVITRGTLEQTHLYPVYLKHRANLEL